MTCVSLENFAKYQLSRLTIPCHQSSRRLRDAARIRVGQSRPFIRHPRIRVFLKVDQHIAIGQPRGMQRGDGRDDSLQLLPSRLQPAGATIGARKVGTRLPELRSCGDGALESLDGVWYFI